MNIIGWIEEKYKDIKERVTKCLNKVGHKEFISTLISGWLGDNLTKPSDNMEWYNGLTLIDALDSIKVYLSCLLIKLWG